MSVHPDQIPVAIEPTAVARLRPYPGNARTHSKKQIRQIADSIKTFGFTNPVLVSDDGEIIAGHGRVEAAKLLGMESVPTLCLSHLDAVQRRAYVLADNKLALNAGWDHDVLAIELQALVDLDFDVEITGFSFAEVDLVLGDAPTAKQASEDEIPRLLDPETAVTRPDDLWLLDDHRLLCGDPRSRETFDRLMQGESADLVFTDPPCNVAVDGHIGGRGRVRDHGFTMGAGEISKEGFAAFLRETLGHAASCCRDGAIAFVCMDWRHMDEVMAAGQAAFSELKDLSVWTKAAGGMGSFYRGKHELVFVFTVGDAPHGNTVRGRRCQRTNVWDHAGINLLPPGRVDEAAMHPIIKPVALVAEVIKDGSRRGEIVLDLFGGPGTTLIAAQKTGRRARLIEFDPVYCDQILRRFENVTGRQAILEATGQNFEVVADQRA